MRPRITASMLLVLLSGCLTGGPIPAAMDPGPQEDLRRLATWMAGSFSSQEQHQAQPADYYDIRLRMAPIWPEQTDGYWLYVEQAVAQALERPYRQRVYHLVELAPGLMESQVFSMEEPLRFAGAWKQAEPLSELTPEDLSLRRGCSILLRPTGPEQFTGNTVGTTCASSLNGASFAVAEVTVTPGALISWDQGFDDQGNQVWGPVPGGYVFKKLESRLIP